MPNNSCLLICLYQKAAPVGCACCRNATDYGSLPSLNLFFFKSTFSNIVLSLFLFFKPGGQMGCFVYKFVLGSLESFISFVYNSILKSLSYILYEWETIGMWKNPIFCCTIPSKNGLTGCKFFGMFFFERAVSFNGYCPLSLSLPLFCKKKKKKKSSEVIKLVGAGLQTLKTSCSKDSFLLHSQQQRDCFVVALGAPSLLLCLVT